VQQLGHFRLKGMDLFCHGLVSLRRIN